MPIIDFLGKFHPLLVHLPIGILIIALLLVWGYVKNSRSISKSSLRLVTLLGALSATFAAITGYLMSESGSYQHDLVTTHQWLGIALTVISWGVFALSTPKLLGNGRRLLAISLLSVILLLATGHAGGILTHGAGFLNPPPLSTWFTSNEKDRVVLDSNALVYDAVQMVLSQKCFSCHGETKQQGALRLDAPHHLQTGGENGPVLATGITGQSLLVQRLLLPLEEEEHMPPEGRTQLTTEEIDLIRWWVEDGASFTIRIADAGIPENLLAKLLSPENPVVGHPLVPGQTPPVADMGTIQTLREENVVILPVAEGDNYLTASLRNVPDSVMPKVFAHMKQMEKQLIWLECTDKMLRSTFMESLGTLQALQKLDLRRSSFEQGSLRYLTGLENLQVLNLSGASVGLEDIQQVRLPNLKKLYLSLTGIKSTQMPELQRQFPGAHIVLPVDSIPI